MILILTIAYFIMKQKNTFGKAIPTNATINNPIFTRLHINAIIHSRVLQDLRY
jgi:hypothetical protein